MPRSTLSSARETRKRICSDEAVCPARKKPAGQDNRAIGMQGELTSGEMDVKAAGQLLEDQASSTSGLKTTDELEIQHVVDIGSEVPSTCMMNMPPASGIHRAGRATSKLDPVAAAAVMRTLAASGPSAGAARSRSMGSGRVASALLQEARPMDDSGTQKGRRRLRLTSPGLAPGPATGPFSISSFGGNANFGAGLAAHKQKPKRIRILGVPPLEERQAASLNVSVTHAKETTKEATEAAELAAELAAVARASTAMPEPKRRPHWRNVDCAPLLGEAVPQQQKQVFHATLSPTCRNSRILRMPSGEPVSVALRQALAVDSRNPSGRAQDRAASTTAAPTAVHRGPPTATPLQQPSASLQCPPTHRTVAKEPSSKTICVQDAQQPLADAHASREKLHTQAAMQPSAVEGFTQFEGPSAELRPWCLSQDALQDAPCSPCSSSFERRANRASLLQQRRRQQQQRRTQSTAFETLAAGSEHRQPCTS